MLKCAENVDGLNGTGETLETKARTRDVLMGNLGSRISARPAGISFRPMVAITFALGLLMTLDPVTANGQASCSTDTSIAPADPISQLVADDATPLGTRIPLVLVHGIGGRDDATKDGWTNLENYLNLHGVSSKYKIYRFRYDSNQQPVSELGRSFRNKIEATPEIDKPMVIIAHSMGGLVARSFMNNWAMTQGTGLVGLCGGERVINLITLATPHHGTPSANGPVRVPADSAFRWGDLATDLDTELWWLHFGCFTCQFDIAHVNRGDLRYDNQSPLLTWGANLYAGNEVNSELLGFGHTYDSKIIAYFGFLGSNADITDLGADFPFTLLLKFNGRVGDEAGQLDVLGVVIERITSRIFDDAFGFIQPVNFVYNDGVVPIFSASFDGAAGVKRISCHGFNHTQIMQNGDTGQKCNNNLSPFESVAQDLSSAAPPLNFLVVAPSSSWNFGTVALGALSDKSFTFTNTGPSAVSLATVAINGLNAAEFSTPNLPVLPLAIPAGQSQSITVRFQPGSTGSRTATLAVTTDTPTDTVAPIGLTGTGTQAICTATLSATQIEVPVAGGTQSFNVTAPTGCPWVVSADNSLVSIVGPAQGLGFGSGIVSFTVPANSGTLRVANIRFSIAAASQTVLVIQDGSGPACSYQLSSASNNLPASGGTGAFTIATAPGCSWQVSSSQPFVTFSSLTSGSGTAGIAYTVTANPNPSLRFSTVSVTTPMGVVAHVVTQDAAAPPNPPPCSYSLSSTGRAYTSDAWDDAFIVNTASGCTWTASSGDSWVSLLSSHSPPAGGSDSVGFQIFPNAGSTLRIGTITVQGQGQSAPLTYTIWQQPPPVGSPQISLPVTNVAIGDVLVNSRVNQTVQVQNKGTKDLSIAAIFEVSGSQDMFVSSFNPTVVAGGTNTFEISFVPSITGTQTGVFRIQSNDPITPAVDLTVTGNGIPQGQGGTDFIWSNLPPGAPIGLTELATATIGNAIYLFSGHSANTYDPTINQWTALPNLPHSLIDPGAAVINGKIYVVGDAIFNQVQIFDPATQTWSLGAALPDLRQSMAVAAAGGKLYAMGGLLSGTAIASVAVYDPVLNTWSSAHDMITGRGAAAAATVNGLIYVIGGILSQGIRTGVTEIFDPVANSWTNREDMPTRRSHAGIAVLGTDIYVFGGSLDLGVTNVVEKQDTTKIKDNPFLTQTWTEKNPLQAPRLRDAASFVNGKAFVFGGTNNAVEVTTEEEGDLIAAPIANVTQTAASFGDVATGLIGEIAIPIQNAGNAGLTLTYSWSAPNTEIQIFRAPATLAAGSAANLIVRFAPASTGAKAASLTITTNDTSHPVITVNFSGNAVQLQPVVTGNWQISSTIQLPVQAISQFLAIASGNAYVGTVGPGLIGVDLTTGTLKFQTAFSQFPNSFPGILSADTQRVYVPLSGISPNGRVALVDAQSGTVASYATIGASPFASAISLGRLFVTDEIRFTDGHPSPVYALDSVSGNLLSSIPVGFNPNFVAIDANAQRAYVTTFGDEGTPSSGVTVIDTTSNAVVANVPTRYNPKGVVLSGGRAYIVTLNNLEVMDLASNAILARVPLPQDSSGITQSLGEIFVSNPTFSTVTVIDTGSLAVVQTLRPGTTPTGIATDPATHTVYVVNQGDHTIVALQPIQPSFDVSCTPLALSATGVGTSSCTLTGKNGFTDTVGVSCANVPGNSSCTFDTPSVTVGIVPGTVNLTFHADPLLAAGAYSFTLRAAGTTLARETSIPFNVTVISAGLRFVPVTPCRVADTRNPNGPFGGPFLSGGASRGFTMPSSTCNIPATAQAYSVNLTVVPHGGLGFLTAYPCGQSLPLTSTLNSIDGRVKAGAAIVPAGDSGAICTFASNDTDLVLDISGYFVPATDTSALAFYPVAPCRLVDTRGTIGNLGGPSLVGGAARTFSILSSPCNVPTTAQAYSLNFTAVPKVKLGFLTTWPAGQTQPLVSTLNALTGAVTANAAIVPAGTNGDISVFATDSADLVIDINGYFAPPVTGGLSLFSLTPCRIIDTRNPAGAPPFSGTLNVNITASNCSVPVSAQSYVLNATVVPPGPLGFLTMWPQGAVQPLVSTLNAVDGSVTSNMAIVPTTNGSVSAFAPNPTHLVLDISAYFAP